jgi:Na+(H+)/acetate symporter ActP
MVVVVVVVLVVLVVAICSLVGGPSAPSWSMLANSCLAVLLSLTVKLRKIDVSRPQMLHVPVVSARQCSQVTVVSSVGRVSIARHASHVAEPSSNSHA